MDYKKDVKQYRQEVSSYLAKVKRGRRVAKVDPAAPEYSDHAEKVRVLKSVGMRIQPHETPLTQDEEVQFQQWKKFYAPKDSGADYDLRGAFKAGLQPDRSTGHWPDTYKKPNHPTFSDQSVYSSLVGTKPGTWNGDHFLPFGSQHTSMNPVDTIRTGLQALDMGKMSDAGFDVKAHHERLLTTGPFADASKRQAIWDELADKRLNPSDEEPAPIHNAIVAQVPIGLGGNSNGKINALGSSTQQQLKALEQESVPVAPGTPKAPGTMPRSTAPIMSADAMEKDRLRRVQEQAAIESKLRGTPTVIPRFGEETEAQTAKRLGLQ